MTPATSGYAAITSGRALDFPADCHAVGIRTETHHGEQHYVLQ
jgi:hypothetical protein